MQTFPYIHYLRAVAAILVVAHHILSPNAFFGSPLPASDYGVAGVYLFFVVSGFVICMACRDESVTSFIVRRAIRIIPLYWIFTTIKFVLINLKFENTPPIPIGLKEFFLSILFIPHANYIDQSLSFPILYQGWSLNIEVLFYIIFSIGLLVRRPIVARLG